MKIVTCGSWKLYWIAEVSVCAKTRLAQRYVEASCVAKPIVFSYICLWGFPGGASGKEPGCQCRRHKHTGSIPGSGRSPGEGNGNPLQYSCLGNPMDRGAWLSTGFAELNMTEAT